MYISLERVNVQAPTARAKSKLIQFILGSFPLKVHRKLFFCAENLRGQFFVMETSSILVSFLFKLLCDGFFNYLITCCPRVTHDLSPLSNISSHCPGFIM